MVKSKKNRWKRYKYREMYTEHMSDEAVLIGDEVMVLSDDKEQNFGFPNSLEIAYFQTPHFDWSVYRHLENLGRCLPQIAGQKRVIEGDDHSKLNGHKDMFGVFNGPSIDSMIDQRFVLKRDLMPKEKVHVPDYEAFDNFMNTYHGDGAVLCDLRTMMAQKAAKIHIPLEKAEEIDKFEFVPHNFEYLDGLRKNRNIGTKTETAIMLSQIYPVHTLIIKQSPFGPTGMGQADAFGKDGLTERIYFDFKPDVDDDFAVSPQFLGITDTKRNIGRLKTLSRVVPVYESFQNKGQDLVKRYNMRVSSSGILMFSPNYQ